MHICVHILTTHCIWGWPNFFARQAGGWPGAYNGIRAEGNDQVEQLFHLPVLYAACALRPVVLQFQRIHRKTSETPGSQHLQSTSMPWHILFAVQFLLNSLLKPNFLSFDLPQKFTIHFWEEIMYECQATSIIQPEPFWYYWKAKEEGKTTLKRRKCVVVKTVWCRNKQQNAYLFYL